MGIQFTFRLTRDRTETEAPAWAAQFLQNLARYVFRSGNAFAREITGFVVEQSRRAPRSLAHLVPALRSLLRYLHVTGVTPIVLASAVPTVTGWKLAGLAKALPQAQVMALLASCDLDTEVGQRDRAILTVMWRLGCASAKSPRCG